MTDPATLYASPNALAPHYSRFRVSERLLLSGHSHQAWPDCGLAGQQQAWMDAAEYVDDKWERAFAKADEVRDGYARAMDDGGTGLVALGESTHDLIVRWLSALPLDARPKLVTTDGEFHTLRRLTRRLEEDGRLEVVRVSADPPGEIAARLCAATDDRTAAVMVSAVLFRSARIVPGLDQVMRACAAAGAELLVDAYHAINAIEFPVRALGLERAFVTGGGYKYCQLGEGNAFLRYPRDCRLRPVITGWYAEFDALTARHDGAVAFGDGPHRFDGATYDPTSHYRAAEVFLFHAQQGLTPRLLREVSRHQVGLLMSAFDALDLDPALIRRDHSAPPEEVAGFLTLFSPRARELRERLNRDGVYCDHREDALRLGPAPYLSDDQIRRAVDILGGICRDLEGEA